MGNNLKAARVSQPGRILKRELEARGWTQKDLANIMNRPPQVINEIIKGTKQITPETAIELSKAFGTSAKFWQNLEANYQLFLAKKQESDSDIQRRSRLYTIAPVTELIKCQWIKPTDSLDKLEQEICDFLGIKNTLQEPVLGANFRHNHQLNPEYTSLIAWKRRVEFLAKQYQVADFNLEQFKLEITRILSCAEEEEMITRIPKILEELGVYFIIVPHLNKTYLDGATFPINDNPVIALTLRYNRIDSFWFTLMHEIGHIVAEHEGIYLDNLTDLEDNKEEVEANTLAKNWLITPDTFSNFVQENQPKFSGKVISDFAKTQKRHPGIILGRLQYEKLVDYKNLRKYLVKVSPYLSNWIDN
ncbi:MULTISPECIES: HigA family addiction module antitoxin [Crocosphaera]|uniref:Plasmid maintenance system antidote protein, XRE family n=3 Tax=Crocosphaera watsonii TaxID=263511 RepID=T2JT50_CROWT|nr:MULTISPECIES: HigA family addiction module antitoxin [Crocosphaera]EHJ14970.1 plasmid maintenance system antidote protein, XRE family [Crocosphaera watsonii WH 0003]MCH2245750.1 HigA family addiction module antitoxin [Crocosphaera sp.]CCQ58602.1 Helix-turn-helix motif [Crocosphaera watsonii WH 0005]CCQ69018.1 plasmid maintenance system antidote protein, XRE family [Crocosphaera watsonii WH 0402]